MVSWYRPFFPTRRSPVEYPFTGGNYQSDRVAFNWGLNSFCFVICILNVPPFRHIRTPVPTPPPGPDG